MNEREAGVDGNWLRLLREMAGPCLGLSLVIGLMGTAVTFVPGSELSYFGVTAALSVPGLFSRKWKIKAAALALFVLWSLLAFGGFMRGLEYREKLPVIKKRIENIKNR